MVDALAPAAEVFIIIFELLPFPIVALFNLVLFVMLVFFAVELLHKWGS